VNYEEDVAGPGAAPEGSLARGLTDRLRLEIVNARMRPGEMLLEKALASRYGVSKTPVREALQTLAAEDWLILLPRRGYMVKPISFTDVKDVLALRRYLEPNLAAAAAERVRTGRPELLADIEEHLRRQEQAPDAAEAVQSAQHFHEAITEAAGNPRAARVMAGLYLETHRANRLLPQMDAYMKQAGEFDDHRRIAQALRDGDAEAARDAMAEHLRRVESSMVEAFLNQ